MSLGRLRPSTTEWTDILSLILACWIWGLAAPALNSQQPAPAPEICRVSAAPTSWQAKSDYAAIVFGENFGANTKVRAWLALGDEKVIFESAKEVIKRAAELPASPPKEAKECEVLRAAKQVMVVLLPLNYTRTTVVWAGNGDKWSRPFAVNKPEIWWLSHDKAVAGEVVRAFGRNFVSEEWGKPYVFVADSQKGKVQRVEWGMTQNSGHDFLSRCYELSFRLPDDLPAGEYHVFVHNGSGGRFGFSNSKKLTVAPREPLPTLSLNVSDFGGMGNGVKDDAAAIQAAIDKAAAQGGGTVFLPAGRYALSHFVIVKEGVTLQGAGADATTITSTVHPVFAPLPWEKVEGNLQDVYAQSARRFTPLCWATTRCTVKDIRFLQGLTVEQPS